MKLAYCIYSNQVQQKILVDGWRQLPKPATEPPVHIFSIGRVFPRGCLRKNKVVRIASFAQCANDAGFWARF